MNRDCLVRRIFVTLTLSAALWSSSCAVPLGPGYEIQKQQITVRLETAAAPAIHVDAAYQLKNTGNRPLSSMEIRLPARRFHVANLGAAWDGADVALDRSPQNPGNLTLQFQQPWGRAVRHTLRLSFEIRQGPSEENHPAFTSSAFFLTEVGWSPELAPSQGLLGFGGVPPEKWDLFVSVPQEFRVHASGAKKKQSRSHGMATFRFEQKTHDFYPFVVAGRYSESPLGQGKRTITLWTISAPVVGSLAGSASILGRELNAYDAAFGPREKQPFPLWIVECPAQTECVTERNAPFTRFFGLETGAANAEIVSHDTVLVDFTGEPSRAALIAAPSLAASSLGYGRNPAFFEQEPPLSMLPVFAAALGREAVEAPSARSDMIRRALQDIPASPQPGSEQDPRTIRAKSFLFFYALRDRYGPDAFRNAVQHMLSARRGRGFGLEDFIAAFEQETHQNIAEFVRLWMKHPGVPEEFRARYENAAAVNPVREEKHP